MANTKATKTVDLNWMPVDVDSLPANCKVAYEKLRKAQAAVKQARDDFEGAFTQAARKAERLETGNMFAFAYKFGNVAVAIKSAEDTQRKSASKKPTFSF